MSIPQLDFEIRESEPTMKTVREPKPGQKKRGRRSNASIEAEIRDELTAFMQLAALFWSTRDDYCATVLNEQAPLIAEDIASLAAKSEWARKYLTKTLDMGKLIPLMMHTLPVLQAVREHHIAPRAGEEAEDGGQGSLV